MAKIYLVRHGESVANTKGIYQGQTYDTPLSAMGKRQAMALARYFENVTIDKIFASPLIRTKETAQKVASFKHVEIVNTREIIETNHGQWEGLEKRVILNTWHNLYQLWLTKPSGVTFPGGETFQETKRRVVWWWNNIIKENTDLLVVTHDNIIRIIVSEVLGLKLDNIWKFNLHPAAVTIIEIDNSRACKLLVLDDKCHLNNLMVNIGNHAL